MNSKLEGAQKQVNITGNALGEKGSIEEKSKNNINNEIYILFQTVHMLKNRTR